MAPLLAPSRLGVSTCRRPITPTATFAASREAASRVVILGGTGRVGASTAVNLLNLRPNVELVLAGRSRENYARALDENPTLANAMFLQTDADDKASVKSAIDGADLLVHCAGPFQRLEHCHPLDACIEKGVPYVDVADDTEYTMRCRGRADAAKEANVPAVTSAGIFPGASNVMAADMLDERRAAAEESGEDMPTPERLLFSYFTAGSGGVGTTILASTFLLATEDVTCFKDGEPVTVDPVSNRRVVDFGKGVGSREVFLYNLPEVATCHETLGIPSVSARFGTSPGIWNGAMLLLSKLPRPVSRSRAFAGAMAALSDPIVRLVDKIEGEKVAMRVEIEWSDGAVTCSLFNHPSLRTAVGAATAAFADAALAGDTPAGVWVPEQTEAVPLRKDLLEKCAAPIGAIMILGKSPWRLGSDSVQLGMGLYVDR
ncbi:hypothetical protein PPROV_000452000 [Pycnococcus provasolii]|uniref:Saccharopine dehydrogenase NADP binding domain-containing protein n=1 Tax=Pycnococcus provasolii TaxID=41880 RepID=A0A830HJN3_9CHLO|nr:hypothetical protein PPROV_000452000 [Pycnococcus provasolii]